MKRQDRKILSLEKKLERKDNSIPKLKKKVWNITSLILRKTLPDKCYTCDHYIEPKRKEVGHFWAKGSHGATYFDFRNLRIQCHSCNLFKSGNLAEYACRLRRELGEDEFSALEKLAHTPKRWSRAELTDLLESRKALLNEIEMSSQI